MTDRAQAERAERIATHFVEARRTGTAMPDYPAPMPTTLDDGYRIQDAAIVLAGRQIAGWKVGRVNPPVDGVDRLSGPIFADRVVGAGDRPVAMPIIAGGFGAAEAEFVLRLGAAPDPAKTRYTMDETRALIGAVHVGIEIASSPFPGINRNGAPVTIADFGNNNGLLIGDAIADWRAIDLDAWPVTLAINGAVIGSATAAMMLDGPLGAARFLLEHLAERGIALSPGQWISTGAVTGVHPVAIGDHVATTFGDRLAVTCTITTD